VIGVVEIDRPYSRIDCPLMFNKIQIQRACFLIVLLKRFVIIASRFCFLQEAVWRHSP
jgi:hypothetical protein